MKRLRFLSGVGNGTAIIPGGQVLDISMLPGANGSWVSIANSKPIWVPGTTSFELGAEECGACNCRQVPFGPMSDTDRCEAERILKADMWPGDQQISIIFGEEAAPNEDGDSDGDPPQAWFVVYNGC